MDEETKPDSGGIPVVAIGASAGGLEALRSFFARLSPGTGAAYVIVQHLAPDQKSILHELLQARTGLDVTQIADGERVHPNHVYVVPPGKVAEITGDALHLDARDDDEGLHRPIDAFFASLAGARGRDAYCVILSGTGSDGSQGLKKVKEAGGFALVQESRGARFPGMPDSAVATGLVDFILPVDQIPDRLDDIIRHRRLLFDQRGGGSLRSDIEEALPRLTRKLREVSGNNFSDYKPGTLVRRTERRMSLRRISDVSQFLDLLEKDDEEANLLAQEFLIGVTAFFRDPDAFEALRSKVLVPLLERSPDGVRIWVPGCSTGEEVYSIAMLLLEEMRRRKDRRHLQVFGTDIDAPSLIAARNGIFSPASVEILSVERRDEFFRLENGQYRAVPELRETCVFAPHNLVQDPPFSRLDLVSCRNLMIYLSTRLQKELIPRFHFTLKRDGHLFLGTSEGLSGEDDLFDVVDKDHRIFRKRAEATTLYSPLMDTRPGKRAVRSLPAQPPQLRGDLAIDLTREEATERQFLRHHASPFALLSKEGEVLYLSQGMTQFVRPSQGTPSSQIDAYLTTELRVPVRTALADAANTGAAAGVRNVLVMGREPGQLFDVDVSPGGSGDFLLVLNEVRAVDAGSLGEAVGERQSEDREILETENVQLRKQLAVTLQEFETSGQELKSSNEELMSMNEELQSSNEELETSREELQSINEELETVNAELQENNRQLVRANSDLKNLFESTDLAVLFLDRKFCVRNFTPSTTTIFGIRHRDIGRPIADLSSRIDYPDLKSDAQKVDETLQTIEREVRIAASNETFLLRVKPYRTTDNRIDGYVLSFVDITRRKSYEEMLKRNESEMAKQYAELENLYDTTPVGLALMDSDLRWVRVNETLAQINGFPVDAHIGKRLRELLPDLGENVENCYRRVFETGEPVLGVDIEAETMADPGRARNFIADFYPVMSKDEVFAVGSCVREVTDQARMITKIQAQNDQQKLLLGELQHRVKNTLATIGAISRLLLRDTDNPADYQKRLADRLAAISRAHDLLTDAQWTTATFGEILANEARPYVSELGEQISLTGPELTLLPRESISLGMAVHELMTNAAKYGALSSPEGRIEIATDRAPAADGGQVTIRWKELGGPAIDSPPERRGFGSIVIERVLVSDLSARVDIGYPPEGLTVEIGFVPEAPQ